MVNYVTTTNDLIRFRSVDGNENGIERCVSYVEEVLEGYGMHVQRYTSGNDRGEKTSLIASFQERPKIILSGHLDVIPADDSQFVPKEMEGMIYGRGSCDMKGSVAVFLDLMSEYSRRSEKPSVGVMFTTDEEIGGDRGGKYLLHDVEIECDFAIVGEPTNLDVCTKEKGVLHFRVVSYGKAAHGATPYEGKNAIEKLMDGVQDVKNMYGHTSEDRFWLPSVNLGKIQGGELPNKVPDRAEGLLDVRYVESEQREEIIRVVGNFFDESEVMLDVSMMRTDDRDPHVLSLREKRKEVTGERSRYSYSKVFSDGRFFTEKGISVVSFGPVGAGAHGPDEWVDIESLGQYREILSRFVEEHASQ